MSTSLRALSSGPTIVAIVRLSGDHASVPSPRQDGASVRAGPLPSAGTTMRFGRSLAIRSNTTVRPSGAIRGPLPLDASFLAADPSSLATQTLRLSWPLLKTSVACAGAATARRAATRSAEPIESFVIGPRYSARQGVHQGRRGGSVGPLRLTGG